MYIWLMLKKGLILLFFMGSFISLFSQGDSATSVVSPFVNPALKFTENKGQWDSKILFRAQLDGGALFVEKNCLTFNFYDKKKFRSIHNGGILKGKDKNFDIRSHAYKIHFAGCNPSAISEKYQEGSDYENFFIGNDQSRWKGDVRNYHQIWLRNLYDNIDYEVITAVNGLKYNFHIKPHGNVADINLKYEGVDNITLKNGTIYLKLDVNEIKEQKPYAYQLINGKVRQVACNYILKNKVLSFDFPNGYNKNYELVIDPVLVFAAQSGSTADNFGMTATFDTQGNLYSGGTIFNIGYPVTPGAYSATFNGPVYYGNTDVVITKYNSTGTNLVYSTYLGGNYTESINSMIVDKSNNLCFFGSTSSTTFPTTVGCYDNSFNGGTFLMFYYNGLRFHNGTDIFIGKLNNTGTALLASTYLGGSGNDGLNHSDQYSNGFIVQATPPATGNITIYQPDYDSLQTNYGDQSRGEIQVDANNNIYIASSTRSSNFPAVNGFDNSLNGTQDGILAKFNSNLTTLIYSSFIGGNATDAGYGLIVKNNSEVYVTGGTSSNNFPYAAGGYQASYQGGNADGYIIRVNAAGNAVLNGTYFGTPSYDQSFFIQSDKKNNIYIYGQSLGNIPVIKAATSPTVFNVPGTHQFISRLNANLTTLNMSTVFGNYTNNFDISPAAFSVDNCNNIYISGWGANFLLPSVSLSNMPLLFPTQSTTDGFDFYFMGLDSNAAALKYGSYFGGNISQEHVDGGTSRFDPQGKIYQSVCAGCGGNAINGAHQDFPVTPGAWPNTPGNPNHNTDNFNCNNGVIKLDFQLQLAVSTINTNTLSGCLPLTVTFTNATPPTGSLTTFIWYLGNGSTTTTNINPTVTYTLPGTYTVSLVVNDPSTCNIKDSSVTFITVFPKPASDFTLATTPCSNSILTTNASTGTFTNSPYSWNFGDGSPVSTATNPPHTYLTNGNYTVSLTVTDVNGCTDVKTTTVSIFNFTPGIASGSSFCYGQSASLSASGGTSYTWSPAAGLSNTNTPNPTASPSVSTVYSVHIENNTPGYTCASNLTVQITVYPKPVANFTYNANPCGGGVYFNDLSTPDVTTWEWYLSSTPSVTSAVQNPYHFYATGGTHTVVVITTNNYGCKDTANQTLTILTPPPVSVSPAKIICKGESAQLSASGGVSYTWTPTVSLDFPNSSTPNATPTISTQYSVVITSSLFVGGNQCSFLLTTNVNVTQLSAIPIGANANPVIVTTGSATTLTYLGSPGVLVTWLPLGSTTPATGYTVTAYPDRPTTYTAVATLGPCKETATVNVEAYSAGCLDEDVFVPNTFTPNNDGKNDILYVRGIKVDEVYFAVYNRWGEKVFDTNDKSKGWDGIYKSRPADVGVFGWYLKVKCINGEESFKKGNVTLIR
ncbi:MAG: gliding motility-associated C-terminal domain-containing protein [Bacteroidia bacterium]|nr:gliding motility-associated C-terminal domain-containing protein [Bacteroidia bacterium]